MFHNMKKIFRLRRWATPLRMTVCALLAVFLAAMIPGALAEGTEAFTLDERAVLDGMSRSYLQGYEPAASGERLTLVIPVRSEKAVGNIQAELGVVDEASSPFKTQSMSAQTQRVADGLWAVRFQLTLLQNYVNGDYPCTVRVSGTDADGKALQTDIPVIVRVRAGWPNPEPVQIGFSEDKSSLNVGEDGVIALKLTNRSRSIGLEKLSLTVYDPNGDILPKTLDVATLGDLMPGESLELSFPVTVLSTARVAPHSLRFEFNGQALGEPMQLSLSYTVTVRQEIHLEQGGLRMATSAVAGDSVTATLPLMNLGKADIVNAMATISLPGIADSQSVLVGTIQPGETKQAQLTIIVPKDARGGYEGTVVVTGEDNDGNSVSFELPVSLTVEEPVKAVPLNTNGEPDEAEQKSPVSVIVLAAVGAVLAVALIVQGILLRSKIHRLEEDRL